MSKLRSINTAFWSDTWIEDLEPNYKLLFLYLVTNDKTNMLGIYESSKRKISFETGLSLETVSNGLKAFETVNKVKYIDNHIILVNYMRHQNYNTNMKKSAIDIYNNLHKELQINGLVVSKDKPVEGFESLLKGYGMVRKVEVEDETELEEELEGEDEVKKEIDIDSFYDLDILVKHYLSNDKLIDTIINNKVNKIKDKEHLKNRLKEFKTVLIEQGRTNECFKEFAKYFRNWNKSSPKSDSKKEIDNPKGENIITFTTNVNPNRQQMLESNFIPYRENMEQGGYIFKIVE